MSMADDIVFDRCMHCGLRHPSGSLEEIARYCMAVKTIKTAGYVYGKDGLTISHPRVKSIEYFEPDQQRKLFEEAVKANEY